MKPSQTIFNKNNGTVTLSAVEYNKLLLYKELALEMKAILKSGDEEWTAQVTQTILMNYQVLKKSAHSTLNVKPADTIVKSRWTPMIYEILNMHSQINHNEVIRLILNRNGWEITIDKTDILKVTDTGMLRIIRANGNLTSANPAHIALACISTKGVY